MTFFRKHHLSEGDGSKQEEINPWQLIGNIKRTFDFSIDEILHEISYANLIMYMASIPQPTKDKIKEADMSKNNNIIGVLNA